MEIVSSASVAVSGLVSGGTMSVLKGGTANGTVVSGGAEVVDGTANATTVSAGGSAAVSSGGQANGLVIASGGSATVSSGGAVLGCHAVGRYARDRERRRRRNVEHHHLLGRRHAGAGRHQVQREDRQLQLDRFPISLT